MNHIDFIKISIFIYILYLNYIDFYPHKIQKCLFVLHDSLVTKLLALLIVLGLVNIDSCVGIMACLAYMMTFVILHKN
jgi:hypothetical protein